MTIERTGSEPDLYGPVVAKMIANELLNPVLNVFSLTLGTSQEQEFVRAALEDAVLLLDDGFAIGKILEAKYHFGVNAAVVNVLSGTKVLRRVAHMDLMNAWYKTHRPPRVFAVGDHVVLKRTDERYTVRAVSLPTLTYSLFPSLPTLSSVLLTAEFSEVDGLCDKHLAVYVCDACFPESSAQSALGDL